MNLNTHSNYVGKHAFLSPSNYHWVNYDDDKLDRVYHSNSAAVYGSELHALAHDLIRLGVKLPETESTLNMYVNDAIGYRMTPECVLYYSENCFGQADAVSFRNNRLRVHDLKTGLLEAKEMQLNVYGALFCLEYKFKPNQIEIENRIYQNNDVHMWMPEPDSIFHIMDRIVTFSRRLDELRTEDL